EGGRRQDGLAPGRGGDLGGVGLLATSTSAGMLAISSLAGLRLPVWGGAALARFSLRSAPPLLDLPALGAAGAGPALGGALCSFLVLFGPLVLFPQVIAARGGSATSAGLLLTALPAGFGLAAVAGGPLVPGRRAPPH